MQFGDDWPGTFIRGDTSKMFAVMLEAKLKGDKTQGVIFDKILESLVAILQECDLTRPGKKKTDLDYNEMGDDDLDKYPGGSVKNV